jgi:hypothetical protein
MRHPEPRLAGDEINEMLGIYLNCLLETKVESELTGPVDADEVLMELLREELTAIAETHPCPVMFVLMDLTRFAIHASAIAQNEPPRKAIIEIAALLSQLRARLRSTISDAKGEAA